MRIALQEYGLIAIAEDLLDRPCGNRREISKIFKPLDDSFPSSLRQGMTDELGQGISSRISPFILPIVEKIRRHRRLLSVANGGLTALVLAQGMTVMERTLVGSKHPYLFVGNLVLFPVWHLVKTNLLAAPVLQRSNFFSSAKNGAFIGVSVSLLRIIYFLSTKALKPATILTSKRVRSIIATMITTDALRAAICSVGSLMIKKVIHFSERIIERKTVQIIQDPRSLVDQISKFALSGIRLVSKIFR